MILLLKNSALLRNQTVFVQPDQNVLFSALTGKPTPQFLLLQQPFRFPPLLILIQKKKAAARATAAFIR